MLYKNLDFDADKVNKQYFTVRESMSVIYLQNESSFGPVSVPNIPSKYSGL